MQKLSTFIFVVCFAFTGLWAESGAKDELNRAIRYYHEEKYRSAADLAGRLFDRTAPEVNPYASVELILLINSHEKTGNYNEMMKYGRILAEQFPESRYLPGFYLSKANLLYHQKDYVLAYYFALQAAIYGNTDAIRGNARTMTTFLSQYILSSEELQSVDYLVNDSALLPLHRLNQAQQWIESGNRKFAEKTLVDIRSSIDDQDDISMFNSLLRDLHDNRPKTLKIVLLLPLTGDYEAQGSAILNGLKFGLDKYRNTMKYPLELIILDTESDTKTTILQAQKAVNIKDLIAIIGPLSSESALAVAPICNENHIPLVTPTATIEGLTEVGDFIFQLNTGLGQRGYNIGAYAVDSLGLKTFATVAPADDYGRTITLRFIEAVERRGGEVLQMIWYQDEPRNMRHEFKELRNLAFSLLKADTSDTNNILLDSTLVLKTASDSLKLKMDRIEGIYLPVYESDIPFLAPQLAYWNFDTQLLGDGNWNNPDILENFRTYVNGLIFVTSTYWDDQYVPLLEFKHNYKYKTGQDATELHVFGYETIILLMNIIQKDNIIAEELQASLASMNVFKGLIRDIQFNERAPRVNANTPIFQYKNHTIKRIF